MTGAQRNVAIGAILVALACAALMIEAGRRVYRTLGPTHAIASADGSLYVVSHGRIHVFAPSGERRASIDLAELGAAVKPSDVALHADGRIVLVDPDTSLLHRCPLPRGPCETVEAGLTSRSGQEVLPGNAAKLAIDDAAQRYYISDNQGHRVLIADFSGRVLAASRPGDFRYPNHLFVAAPGELSVVDTNHHRIATYDVHGDRFGPQLRQVYAGVTHVSRPHRAWPFDSAPMPKGETAVLVADNAMRDADLVVLDERGHADRRIDLGADSDPFDVERWGDRLVVADGKRYRLQAVGFDGRIATDFPPADFAAELAHERSGAEFWTFLQSAARIAVVAVPLIAILVLWRMGVPLGPVRSRARS